MSEVREHLKQVSIGTIFFIVLKVLEVDPVSGWPWWAVLLGPCLADMCFYLALGLIPHCGSSLSARWGRRSVEDTDDE